MNIFDIIGPAMIGPSSSHTAGAARLGLLARGILGDVPKEAVIRLYGSFARTYKGHGTDLALLAGLLGWQPDDGRIPEANRWAKESGLVFSFCPMHTDNLLHPNTASFELTGQKGGKCSVTGASLGGGRVVINEIDGFPVELTGDLPTLLTIHEDRPGIVSAVSSILAGIGVNIASMRVFRQKKGGQAAMAIEVDQHTGESILPLVSRQPGVEIARLIDSIA